MQHHARPGSGPVCDDDLRAAAAALAASWRQSTAGGARALVVRARDLSRLEREAARYGAAARAAAMPPERLVPALRECVTDGVKRASADGARPREFGALWQPVLRAALAAYYGTDAAAERRGAERAVDADPRA